MRVLVTGGQGQLGTALGKTLEGHEATLLGRDELDISSFEQTLSAIEAFRPDVVIHTAAMTDVDLCEREPDLAYTINAYGAQNVALACERIGAAMLAVSTDFVFDGEKGEPYDELDDVAPISVYGRSKLMGEMLASEATRKLYIARTAWVFSAIGKSFVRTMLIVGAQRDQLQVIEDELGTPTYAPDLARAIVQMIQTERYGTYHLVNEGDCNRFELAKRAIEGAGLPTIVSPISAEHYLSQYPLLAKRPKDSRLRNFAARTQLGIELRGWEEALDEMLTDR